MVYIIEHNRLLAINCGYIVLFVLRCISARIGLNFVSASFTCVMHLDYARKMCGVQGGFNTIIQRNESRE